MAGWQWTCSTCGRHVTLTENDAAVQEAYVSTRSGRSSHEAFLFTMRVLRCPNPTCLKSDVWVQANSINVNTLFDGRLEYSEEKTPVGIGDFQFLPTTPSPLSSTVPAQIVEDYREAYLIRDLSPKASATLARRALQGMVRDYWKISRSSLDQELKAIEDKCDTEIYAAMMAVKSVGNIGAHPERDISQIVDIEHGEPQQLLDVLHLLDQEWYVARAERQARIAKMTALGADKKAQKDANKP